MTYHERTNQNPSSGVSSYVEWRNTTLNQSQTNKSTNKNNLSGSIILEGKFLNDLKVFKKDSR